MTKLDQNRFQIWRTSLRARCGLQTTVALLFILAACGQFCSAQTFTVLYSFTGGVDGGNPSEGLARDVGGNLFGTTYNGGSGSCTLNGSNGCGTVFKVTADGAETVLLSFGGGSDGAYPWAGLTLDTKGNLYGTTTSSGLGYGVAFKLETTGTETILHRLAGSRDGATPYAGLAIDRAGDLWGTSTAGGDLACGVRSTGCGTLFKLRGHKQTILHRFAGAPVDGSYPGYGDLLVGNGGSLYGVTMGGGPSDRGTVYRLDQNGRWTLLYSFTGGPDGCVPSGTLATDDEGSLYGTTAACGLQGYGTVYKLNKAGVLQVLYSFGVGSNDGRSPYGGVIRDRVGNLYGTTLFGGMGCSSSSQCGTVFKLSQTGKITILHMFDSLTDGAAPWGNVIRDAKGNLYGTTNVGGPGGFGTVWKVAP
jgi:uncharacterized repeat protein (TIGR03803 family)